MRSARASETTFLGAQQVRVSSDTVMVDDREFSIDGLVRAETREGLAHPIPWVAVLMVGLFLWILALDLLVEGAVDDVLPVGGGLLLLGALVMGLGLWPVRFANRSHRVVLVSTDGHAHLVGPGPEAAVVSVAESINQAIARNRTNSMVD